ncbi:MAG TPA: 3TM-type holin [Terriglobia bacterium]|nr:3TM-type holin [Terriglobia bacterium]
MGGFAGIFKGLVGGDPIKSIGDLIDQFHMSPEQKAQLGLDQAQLEERRDEIEAARDEALAAVQSKNITAETQSEDAYVRRARPTFLYMMILAIGIDLIIFPVLSLATHHGLNILEIPGAYLELFGVGFLGYTGARSWEKTRGTTDDIRDTLQIHADRLNRVVEKQATEGR